MGRFWFGIGLGLAVVLLVSDRPAIADDFQHLVRGNDLEQFVLVNLGPKSISIEDGEIHLTGKPDGYFATRASYRNYVLQFEWKYERPEGLKSESAFQGNSGLLMHIAEPHQVWPRCIESQLLLADAGHLFAVSGAQFRGSKDTEAQRKATRPVGEWNLQEVTCKDGAIVCTINGIEVSRGEGASPDHGPIAWQSEGAPIRFRNLRIKVDDPKD